MNMLAECMIVETDTSGIPKNFPKFPPNAKVEIICLILEDSIDIPSMEQPSCVSIN